MPIHEAANEAGPVGAKAANRVRPLTTAFEEDPMIAPMFHFVANAPKPVGPYSHAVEAGGWLFVTGQIATDPDDDDRPLPEGIEAQTLKVLSNIERVLAGMDASLEHVVCVRIFLTEFERDYATLNRIYRGYFADGRLPARTTVGVTHLARGAIVEIDMIAYRPR
jgi:2-iminobutanoate/2-iminopropanoate deaminase